MHHCDVFGYTGVCVCLCCSDGGSDSSVSDGPPVHLQYSAERVSEHYVLLCSGFLTSLLTGSSSLGLDLIVAIPDAV